MSSAGHARCKSRGALLAVAVLALSPACAVKSPPQIFNSTGGAAGTRDIAFVPAENESALRQLFRENLKVAFKKRAVANGTDAEVFGDFAISTLPANVELASTVENASATSPDNGSERTAIVTQSASRESKFLDKCEGVRFRATLVLFDKSSGERIHRAEGEATGCEGDRAPLRALANTLVSNAILSPR